MTKAGIGAGAVAALLLCWAEAAWIGSTFPRALEPVGGAFDFFRATAPPAVVTGAALGCLLVVAAAMARRGVQRWLPPAARETRWLALAGTALVMVAFGALAAALLRGRQARALLAAHPLLLAAFAAALAGACYGCVLLLLRAVRGSPSRAARWAAMAGCAAIAAGCYVADRVVLVRLYEPIHLALRAGAFVSALLALLLAWKLTAPTPARRRTARWSLAAAGAVSLLLLLADTVGPARARRLAASNVMHVHGAIGEGLVALGDALAGSRTRAPSARAATVVADRHQSSHSEVLAPGANILLVTVDALRADHLEPYGYPRSTTPNLSRLAADSVVFERAYTSAPHTSFAITSLLTGYPAMSLANRGMLDGTPTLAELARAHGYRTAAFYPPAVFFVDGERLKAFEDHAFGFEFTMADGLDEDVSAEVQTDRVLAFLTERSPERFLAWVHYFAPHEPYVEHPDDGPSFGPRAVDRYDGEIRWVDRHIGRLIARVRARHPYTIVVVTADHGEEFGEHGGAYHGTTLFDEQVKVPLLVSIPGVDGARIRAPVSTTAVVPTVLGATGMRAGARFDGTDLTPWLAARELAVRGQSAAGVRREHQDADGGVGQRQADLPHAHRSLRALRARQRSRRARRYVVDTARPRARDARQHGRVGGAPGRVARTPRRLERAGGSDRGAVAAARRRARRGTDPGGGAPAAAQSGVGARGRRRGGRVAGGRAGGGRRSRGPRRDPGAGRQGPRR